MCIMLTVIKFVHSLRTILNTSTLSPKNVLGTGIPSSNLFLVAVMVENKSLLNSKKNSDSYYDFFQFSI